MSSASRECYASWSASSAEQQGPRSSSLLGAQLPQSCRVTRQATPEQNCQVVVGAIRVEPIQSAQAGISDAECMRRHPTPTYPLTEPPASPSPPPRPHTPLPASRKPGPPPCAERIDPTIQVDIERDRTTTRLRRSGLCTGLGGEFGGGGSPQPGLGGDVGLRRRVTNGCRQESAATSPRLATALS